MCPILPSLLRVLRVSTVFKKFKMVTIGITGLQEASMEYSMKLVELSGNLAGGLHEVPFC